MYSVLVDFEYNTVYILSLQETGIRKTLHILEHTIRGIAYHDVVSGQCFKIADLGCSSSKNTLLVASSVIDIVVEICKENNSKPLQFQVCLNDLFENDFNNLLKMLPEFYATLEKEKVENMGHCFVSAVPGSFYGRLFPDQSMHFVHSSYSLHWLSQVSITFILLAYILNINLYTMDYFC